MVKRLEKLLAEKRISYNPDSTWFEANRVGGLYELINDWFNSNFIVAEIGSCEGSSTELFALTCKFVYTIDPWDLSRKPNTQTELEMAAQSEEKYRKRMAKYDNVETIKGFSEEVAVEFDDNYLDAVYIDGAHDTESVKNDIDLWLPKIKDGGILCGHDWSSRIVQHVILNKFKSVEKVYKDDSWAIVKNF